MLMRIIRPFVVQAHYHYLNEIKLNEKFNVRLFVVDCDKNKMHLCLEIYTSSRKSNFSC